MNTQKQTEMMTESVSDWADAAGRAIESDDGIIINCDGEIGRRFAIVDGSNIDDIATDIVNAYNIHGTILTGAPTPAEHMARELRRLWSVVRCG